METMEKIESNIVKLRGKENFLMWKFQVTIHLRSYGVLGVTTGKEKKPDNTSTTSQTVTDIVKSLNEWNKRDGIAQRIISTTIDQNLLIHIISCESSAEMWDKLIALFEKKTEESKCEILQEFFSATYQKNTQLTSHVAKLESIYARLKIVDPNADESLLVSKILTTLPDKMNFFKTAWEMTTKGERTLSNLKARLQTEDNRDFKPKEEAVAFEASVQRSNQNSSKKNNSHQIKCYNCNKMGNHISKNCTEPRRGNKN